MIRALRGASDEVVLAISKEFASIPVERRFSKVCKAARRGMHAMNILRLSQMVMIHQAHEMEVEVVDGGDFGGGDWRRDNWHYCIVQKWPDQPRARSDRLITRSKYTTHLLTGTLALR